ncbi:hypothetical protein GCM10011391_07340 [Pullulanibacillus camelliae]|uniref:PTS fructose transporter subunit IIBC n=1 Tax=Pullulanibacillus camelliae TaxID=1707096 RepID=A0A8J2VLF3_9BACL|nr:hypothetical protein GCM10011391_07340 [Pullulanibacillus camelliae]
MKLLAITSCPNGIAHTYMAAENLQKAADEMGVGMKVETQGSVGVDNALTEKEIAEADGIIISADKTVAKDRFVGKRLIEVPVSDGIRKPEELITRFKTDDVPVYQGTGNKETAQKGTSKSGQPAFYRDLMNGVSYMIPFVVIGGLFTAIALAFGGHATANGIQIPKDSFWYQVQQIGGLGFQLMVPILSGFIAMSIADRPGLAPGMIVGFIANTGSFYHSDAGAGFIGGIIAGFLVGYIAKLIKMWKAPKMIQPIMPILVIPLLTAAIAGGIFILVLGHPIASLMTGLENGLNGMQGASKIILAVILGAMIAFDMGGPFNKVAFLFGSAMIAQGNTEIMGPIAIAICVPPIGMGLATFLGKKKYAPEEQEAGKASFTMGLFGITEGAIPLAAGDPLRVIPSNMAGAIVGAIIGMVFGVTDRVPHGGPIVAAFGAVSHVIMFFVAIIVGVLVTALMANLLKRKVKA